MEFVRKNDAEINKELSNQQYENGRIMIHRKQDVVYLSFPLLDQCEGYMHGFSTRLGGVSSGVFESMNLGFSRGDDQRAVIQNYERIAEAIGFSKEAIVLSDQTHTTNVRIVTKEDKGNGIVRPKAFFETDGLVTNVPGLVLTTMYADCVPLYFIDPVQHVIGLSHSGWKGTVGRIGQQTISVMHEAYGSEPSDMIVAIGPSICVDCYEVSEDVADAFASEFQKDADKILHAKGNGKFQLDLWKANELILLEAGIKKEHLAITDICTCCNPKLLFSHRATNGKRGNLAAFLMIQE